MAYCRAHGPIAGSAEERTMTDKSPRHTLSKKSGKSLKEKRTEKKAKAATAATSSMDQLTHSKKR